MNKPKQQSTPPSGPFHFPRDPSPSSTTTAHMPWTAPSHMPQGTSVHLALPSAPPGVQAFPWTSADGGAELTAEPVEGEELLGSALPALGCQQSEDRVHRLVWMVGRAFGFQAFNLNPGTKSLQHQQHVPATMFLAADHLMELLSNEVLRTHLTPTAAANSMPSTPHTNPDPASPAQSPSPGLQDWHQRFPRAVWHLHSTIFHSYGLWLRNVGLGHGRCRSFEEGLGACAWDDRRAIDGMLLELATFFLLWSEACNLRHCPEALWFLYYCMALSPTLEKVWEQVGGQGAQEAPEGGAGLRERRLTMRNLLQADIASLQQQLHHRPSLLRPGACAEILMGQIHGNIRPPAYCAAAAGSCLSHPQPGDTEMLEDLVAMGDGGSFMDTVVAPLFTVMSYEIDYLVQQGEELAFRLGYDDINESLTHPDIVRRALLALGATKQQLKSGEAHAAYQGITRLGYAQGPGGDGQEGAGGDEEIEASEFDVERAAAFWSGRVFAKTYYERRSWLSIFRAFYRVFCLQAIMLHVLLAAAFTEGAWDTRLAWNAMSSAVITHAACACLERWSNAWMNARQCNPLDKQKASWAWMEGKIWGGRAKAKSAKQQEGATPGDGDSPAPGATAPTQQPRPGTLHEQDPASYPETALDSARRQRRPAPVEGAPVWGVFGFVEWLLVLLGLGGLFTLQYVEVPGISDLARDYWLLVAGGYTALGLGHGLLTMRDGYTTGLTSALRLPRYFQAHSARPTPKYWLHGNLAIGWRNQLLLMLFWIMALGMKGVFDYFVLWKPVVEPVQLLLENRRLWLPCTSSRLIPGLPLPCVDGMWLVVVVRLFPSFLIAFVNLAVAYQLTLIVFGLVRGLFTLDVGSLSGFQTLVREFHRGPWLWWRRAMSEQGNRRVRAAVASRKPVGEDDLEGTGNWSSDDASSVVSGRSRSRTGARGWDLRRVGFSASQLHGMHQAAAAPASANGGGGAAGQGAARRMRRVGSSDSFTSGTGSVIEGSFTSAAGAGLGGTLGRASRASRSMSMGSVSGDSSASEMGDHKRRFKRKGKGRRRRQRFVRVKMMEQSDEYVAMWDSFACAWDEVVDDLREADLISNRESDNLHFIRLGYGAQGVRPILLPLFWTAGQVQKAVDTGLVDAQQSLVLSEMRCLFIFLGCQLDLIPASFAQALANTTFCTEVRDQHHSQSRERLMRACIRMLTALWDLAHCKTLMPEDLQRSNTLHKDVLSALSEVLRCVEVECQAVRAAAASERFSWFARKSSTQAPGAETQRSQAEARLAAEVLLLETKALVEQLKRGERPWTFPQDTASFMEETGSIVGSIVDGGDGPAADSRTVRKAIQVLLRMLTVKPTDAKPSSSEAQRVLGFFMSSLSNRQLLKPCPLHEMLSWTVLTPLYEEDVLFALDAPSLAQQLGCAPAGARALADLLTETEDRVSLMAYLRSVFPKDWECFKERLGDQLGGLDLSQATEADFGPGGLLHELGLQLQLWASFRGQLLARTVRGMMCYEKAIRILARLEYPRGGVMAGGSAFEDSLSRHEYDRWVDALVNKKFSHVVAAQVYGQHRGSRDVRRRWQVEGLDALLNVYPHLKVAFLDTVSGDRGPTQYSVLITGLQDGGDRPEDAYSDDGPQPGAGPAAARGGAGGSHTRTSSWGSSAGVGGWGSDAGLGGVASPGVGGGKVEELYRIRLPQNRYSGRGIIVGEGKPENQNHAAIFSFGEALQTIDMNQDNHLAEALKMRNLLGELGAQAPPGAFRSEPPRWPELSAAGVTASEYQRMVRRCRSQEQPTALVGFREWIFSEKAGALGLFAASAEFAFGTILQRTMDTPARVRMHYGHPDVFNKVHCMTRGGTSKATRQLHISEDIFSGYNHTLRGSAIKYREYISVGKGRDMGFDSILAFELKTSGGASNALISRDLWRLATRFDLFRCLHFYYSGCGYYVNSWLLMVSIYAAIFSLVFFSFTRLSSIETTTYDPLFGTYVIDFYWQNTYAAGGFIQLGTLAVLPYMAELILERGLVRALLNVLHQIVAGALTFFITRQQTTRYYLQDGLQYGGAQYIATGRGFAITSSSFLKLYQNYARTHIYQGFELGFLCTVFYILKDCIDCDLASMTWSFWLVAASLIFGPFWFNPLTFSTAKVTKDYGAWRRWLVGEVDKDTGTSWHTWNRKQLEKVRNDRRNQPNHLLAAVSSVIFQTCPHLLLALSAVSRLDLSLPLPGPSLLRSRYISFAIATLIIWAAVAIVCGLGALFRARAQQRARRILNFWTIVIVVACLVAYLAVLSHWYSGSGFGNLLIIIYANMSLLMAAHRGAVHIATDRPRARALVDTGFWVIDAAVGTTVLAVVGILSVIGIVAWAQHQLLFGSGFARSIRRGQLVRTLGTTALAEGGHDTTLNVETVETHMTGVRSRAGSSVRSLGAQKTV